MTTFATMQSDIADDLDRTDLTSQIKSAINRAIYYYASGGFWFQETSSTFSTSSGTSVYTTATIPSDIREIIYLQITVSSFSYEVYPRDISWIENTDPSNYDGDPTDYAWYTNSIYFSPTPNATRTITVYYAKTYSALSADGDTNDFTTNPLAEELIRARAEWFLYKQLLHDDKNAAASKELEMDALQQLRKQSDNFKLGVKNRPFQS